MTQNDRFAVGTHVRLDRTLKQEAQEYARKVPMAFYQMVEKALLEYMSHHPHKSDKQEAES